MIDRFEKCLSRVIVSLLAIATSLAFLVLPFMLVYMVFMKIMERGRNFVIAGIILLVLVGIYNIIVFLFTQKTIIVEKPRLEKTMGICLRIGGSLFLMGVILTVFMLLAGLLESASELSRLH